MNPPSAAAKLPHLKQRRAIRNIGLGHGMMLGGCGGLAYYVWGILHWEGDAHGRENAGFMAAPILYLILFFFALVHVAAGAVIGAVVGPILGLLCRIAKAISQPLRRILSVICDPAVRFSVSR